MRLHTRTLKLAAPLAVLMVLAAMSPAVAAKRGASGGKLLIGQVVTETNPSTPGSKNTYARQTLNAWAKMVNAQGGINGMKVVVKTVDDGNDPAKASALTKGLIDDGVIAIVGEATTSNLVQVLSIATDAGVPIIGGGCYSIDAIASENFFCVTTTAISEGLKAQIKLVADQGGKSFGITYASDIPAAAAAAPIFKALASQFGVQYTEGVGTTNTQPDYTAACLTFKQSNTTDVGIEGAPLLQNMARDCGRQNYFPKYTSGDGQISQTAWLKDPNIKEAIAAVYSFPFTVTKGLNSEQTASLKAFHSAMNKYAPAVLKGDSKQPATVIWTAALAFGQAASAIPSGTTPSAAAVKTGLYTFKGETLGGLAPNPITFTEGEDHVHNACWFFMRLKNHKLNAPNGMKTTCTP
ncbi:MAG: ABC transporter substrate-binding protein [Acidimicrobiia bacterium]